MSTALRPRAATATTPSVGQASRRAGFWVGFALVALLIVVVAMWVRGGDQGATGVPLGATNAAPTGARALVEVLRQHGVAVTEAASLSEAQAAVDAAGDRPTVLVSDPSNYLDARQWAALAGLGTRTVVVQPSFDALAALAPGVTAAGTAKNTAALDARCTVDAAVRAGRITATGQAYRVSGAARGCFPTGGGAFALVDARDGGRTVDVLGSPDVLSNDGIVRAGNAALALNLLGGARTLVWYLPTLADVPATAQPSLADLTPGWVTPVMVLLFAVALAAALWRGRRFGPLVVENLPVVVRAEETMEGRARLYQRSSARLRALDALRVGATARLATLAGLPRTASVTEVSDAVAALTGRDPAAVRGILLDAVPRSDAELVAGSDRLAELEAAVTGLVRPAPASAAPTTTATQEPVGSDRARRNTGSGEHVSARGDDMLPSDREEHGPHGGALRATGRRRRDR